MTCQNCNSERLADISGKCSDMCSVNVPGFKAYNDYVPNFIGQWGDYLQFSMCLDCGQIQGKFPITDEQLPELTPENAEEEEE